MRLTAFCPVVAVGLFLATWLAAEEPVSAPAERAYSAFSDDPSRQFDFWIGRWDVNLRMQQPDLAFRDSVKAEGHIYGILNGKAILELWHSQPIKGFSLRYFDPAKEKWVLWLSWPNANRASISSLEGTFRHGRGDFLNSWTDAQGRSVTQRYSFNDITPFSLRWDDLTSTDGGKSWAKNWIMEWSRRAVDPVWPIEGETTPTFVDGSRCDAEPFRPYEAIVGDWVGASGDALRAYRTLDGCAVLGFATLGGREHFLFLTFTANGWETLVLDDDRATPIVRFAGTTSWQTQTGSDDQSLAWRLDGDGLALTLGKRTAELTRRAD